MSKTEPRIQFAALMVALLKNGLFEAAEALWDWSEEYLGIEREEFEEEFLSDEPSSSDD